MALQVCNRCRKRRIRCDLQLPSCKNCRVADVECVFWDESLHQDISYSYLHSLKQKVQSLQLELQSATKRSDASLSRSGAGAGQIVDQDYHWKVFDNEDLQSPPQMIFLGPGNSARLLEHSLKMAVDWHTANYVPIPKRLLIGELSHSTRLPCSKGSQSFPATYDHRKVDLHSLLPPSTQRAIIEHFSRTVSPRYSLLPAEQESILLKYENPLKWSNSRRNDASTIALNIIFAISTALIARDVDHNLYPIADRCKEDLQKISHGDISLSDSLEQTRWTCSALCALAFCEVINPVSGQLWDYLGRAAATMEDLRDGYRLHDLHPDEDLRRLERSLAKLDR